MPVYPQHPRDILGNLALKFEHRVGEHVQLVQTSPTDFVGTRGKKHFRLEHETVADDADIWPLAEDFAQAPEKVRTISRKFLNPLSQRDVQAAAEIGNLGLAFTVSCLGGFQY